MKNTKDIIDGFDGLLTREQASRIYSEYKDATAQKGIPLNADAVSRMLHNSANGIVEGLARSKIDVMDKVYRVFNPVTRSFGEKKTVSRFIILGEEGNTINIILSKKASESIDREKIGRGCVVALKSLMIDLKSSTLKSTTSTKVLKVLESNSGINNFSKISSSKHSIDVIGTIVEASPLKRIATANGRNDLPVSHILLSDGKVALKVVCFGLPAMQLKDTPLNSKIKLEFCNTREKKGTIELYADDTSRVLVL
ncbi:hypothetical protein M1583_01535 [Candidatus Marsarchaeota archaeon]|nr:hypothetical protein [Candidatus Marsarchaeota archaeon]